MNAVHDKKPVRPDNPFADAGVLSRLSFWWMRDIFWLGLKRPIDAPDVYECLAEHRTSKLSEYFEHIWNVERQQATPSLFRAIRTIYARKFVFLGVLLNAVDITARIVQPQCLGGLVLFFSPEGHLLTALDAKLYIAGIVGGSILTAIFYHGMMTYCTQIGMRNRQTCVSMIYKKTLRLRKSVTMDGLNGHMINLISNDVSRFDLVFCFIDNLWKGPLLLVLLSYFIYREIGQCAFIAVGFVVFSLPCQMWMGKQTARFRTRTAVQSGRRVRFMNEILQAIQVIKMYTWEKPFAQQIDRIRRKELSGVRSALFVRAIFMMHDTFSTLSTFTCLIAFVYTGNAFTARQMYIVTAYMYTLFNYSVFFWSHTIQLVSEAWVSISRIEKFLLLPEQKEALLKNRRKSAKASTQGKKGVQRVPAESGAELDKLLGSTVKLIDERRVVEPSAKKKGVFFNNATASWLTEDNDASSVVGIEKINLSVPASTLCTVIGAVGSGKSTVLQVILGELELDEGSVKINGSLSYASQEAWLFEGSIRQNIVFVNDFDEERYNQVVKVCALQRDFELFPSGDSTNVAERGNNLSGGQRARINLARAIYRKADIYLLDDPLSAVDTHVGKHIFEQCITQFLKEKVVILVTHQLQYLRNVEHIVLMDNGRIEAQGSFNELHSNENQSLMDKVDSEHQTAPETETEAEGLKEFVGTAEESDNTEQQIVGPSGVSKYIQYFASVNNIAIVFAVFALILLSQGVNTFIDLYLAKWAAWEGTIRILRENLHHPDGNGTQIEASNSTALPWANDFEQDVHTERLAHAKIYVIGMIVFLLLTVHRNFAFFQMCVMASRNMHDRMFRGITRARMTFFNENPSGRILNRFSKDIDCIDTMLPLCLFETLTFSLTIGVSVVLASQWNIWMVLPTIMLGVMLLSLRHVYMTLAQRLKRIEALSRSPILAHTNASLQGLATIRAFNAEHVLTKELETYLDFNTSTGYLLVSATRAFALWVELTAVFYLLAVLCFLLWSADDTMAGSQVGLIISQLFVMISLMQWTIRQQSEVENQMINVQRVLEYADLPAEPPLETEGKQRPLQQWPAEGAIHFEMMSMRYTEHGPKVLHDVNIQIEPKEKIGIVGRTGAGKSSIIQALFRLAYNEGAIRVDGVDIERLGLHDLRSKISIIPQDPILFSGTMRHNLDPFNECTDEAIWKALALVDLKESVSLMAGGLEARLSDGGSNFSLGQRQLVCLARAILRKNRILILDEATANVDSETDRLIQTSIREHFGECTVLTIAHRLHTIMDSDRVLVMEAGTPVEFDRPLVLLANPDGHFSGLVRRAGRKSEVALKRKA